MKKNLMIFMMLGILFLPFKSVKAAGAYSVELVSGSSSNQIVGSYGSYNEAKKVMESHNSNSSVVATIYKNGVPIDSKYAIFKLKPNTMVYLYRDSSSSNRYTYISASYGTDAALLGYSDNGRVKIMVSGFTGWVNLSDGIVTPISLLSGNMINVNGGGVRIRKSPSLASSTISQISGSYNFNYADTRNADGYIWYKINYNGTEAWVAGGSWVTRYDSALGTYYVNYGPTGNLIHHYQAYSGVTYTDNFTNLGTSPAFLTPDQRYYSFDGNYFYDSIVSMLKDYRNGIYSSSINSNNPYYSYYLYLPSHSTTNYSSSDLDNIISSKGYNVSNSKMYGTGVYFKEAEEVYGTNALLAFSTALNESASGTSSIAMNKNNLFGYGAADSCPYDCAHSYGSVRDSIMAYASNSASSYESANGSYYHGSHYGNKSSGKNVMYASDPYWGEKMAMNAFLKDKSYGGKDFNSNTIGVAKKGRPGAWVFSEPVQDSNKVLYTYKNKSGDLLYDYSANVIDKVEVNGVKFYKIYTDLPNGSERFGYVWDDEWNVPNNQPTINAADREIRVGESFDYMQGVTASDVENGDLTGRVTYEGSVDATKEGSYKITYTVSDLNNFHKSKTVNVVVVSDNKVTIEAEDKKVVQFDKFDYMKGVSAHSYVEDLTDSLTYEETVNTSKVGTYQVTYKVAEDSKTINVEVIKNEKPVINADDIVTTEGFDVDFLENVTATDKEDGDISSKVTYSGIFDMNKAGEYKITYAVADKNNQVTTKEVLLKVGLNEAPVIDANSREVIINKEVNLLDGVTAFDKEDGDLTGRVEVAENNLDVTKEGTYNVVYSVKDSKMKQAIKEITVSVVSKSLNLTEGNFYLEHIKDNNGKLEIKGYNTISGIDNNRDTNISYEVEFENIETKKVFKQKATRIMDESEMPKPVFGVDDRDYTYSWFKFDVDLKQLPQGNYQMYVISSSDDYYSKNIINNKTYKKIASSFKGVKNVLIRNNYSYENSPVELVVRDSELASKTADTYYNQFDKYTNFEFVDGKLHLRGLTYSYGMDLSRDATVDRKIIFENKSNYKTYSKDLGSIINGSYEAILPEGDNFGKTRAWYDAHIDLSDIPKGEYVIYLTTKSNITDIYELTEKLGRSLEDVKLDANLKNYSFSINYARGSRIEMSVK